MTKPTSLVLPYGNTNRKVLKLAQQHYKTIFRIGNSFNLSWNNLSGYSYRLNAGDFWLQQGHWQFPQSLLYWSNFFKNSLRLR